MNPSLPEPVSPSKPCDVVQVLHARTRQLVASQAHWARSWRQRTVGLLGHRTLASGEALIFPRCRAIHTIGMRFPIDAIFVDHAWHVVALKPDLHPGQVMWPVWKAWAVIEAAAGTIARTGIGIGDPLNLLSTSFP